jgi:hypothetical protein
MAKVKVYPKKASALNVKHPIDGQLKLEGSMWEQDGFTGRRLIEGAVTLNPDEVFKPAPAATAPAAEPAPAAAAADAKPAKK